MTHWIIYGIVIGVLIAVYVAVFFWGRKKQKEFDAQYEATKRRYDVFVLQKNAVRERPPDSKIPLLKIKVYKVIGRMNLSQSRKGIQINRMQTVTLQTTKSEFKKIGTNHRYKMDVAGNFIGEVFAAAPKNQKKKKRSGK